LRRLVQRLRSGHRSLLHRVQCRRRMHSGRSRLSRGLSVRDQLSRRARVHSSRRLVPRGLPLLAHVWRSHELYAALLPL
jgi:hypothetical protein